MSERQRCRDEVWTGDSSSRRRHGLLVDGGTAICDDSGRWRRRSLFSSERLDLILSNLRRNLTKPLVECRPISRDLPPTDERLQQQLLQQSDAGIGAITDTH